jgi:hypothetical protein
VGAKKGAKNKSDKLSTYGGSRTNKKRPDHRDAKRKKGVKIKSLSRQAVNKGRKK